ncbi:DMT family transporter [Roseovarius spongiae]|uniref:DMT family transporter n=1 Tax=Roseovarius spongiae TaxID=2320272 RepID=A0A3A8AZU3_9RHOB|nr:DMT family transporter [Roseovarius spongiae]RKF17179.1 DMT family transporter [Roseovarius spongiae]
MTVTTTMPQITPRRGRAMGMMVFSSVTISFGGLILRFMQEADAWQIAFWRSWGVIGVIGAFLFWRYGADALGRVRAVGRPGLLAGLMMSGSTIGFLQSITHTTVANTLFMLSAIPFVTAILARVFLGERLRRDTALTMVAAIVGVGVMVAGGIGGGALYGNLMGLFTAVCFSGYAIMVRRHRGIEMLPTLLIAAGIVIVTSGAMRWGDLAIPAGDLGRSLFIGGVLSALANVLFIAAARQLVAAEVTLFMLLEFALGPVWVWLVVAEAPSNPTIVGGVIVIGAVTARALSEISQNRRRRPGARLRPH